MSNHANLRHAASELAAGSLLRRFRRWWRSRDADEQYLGEAVDLADLERRLRVLERSRGGPAFMTYNH
jgi:hypothetical protein